MQLSRPLGQFFTPPEVVDLAFAVLTWLQPDLEQGRLLDLSCGEGAFLAGALRQGFRPECVYGLDVDARLLAVWRDLFPTPARPRLALADGLRGPMAGDFDVVVGNPPFGGGPEPALIPELTVAYEWWRLGGRAPAAFPRELWFLERSLRLLRPGGLLALVLPEGFLANRRWRPQREAMLSAVQMEAVVGLPRSVFRASRTTVKTCLIFARRQPPAADHMVRLAELEPDELAMPEVLLEAWERGVAQASPERPWQRD
jgi:type I restriction enzyme M protein